MGQIKNIKLHIVTDIKKTVKMLKLFIWLCVLSVVFSKPWQVDENDANNMLKSVIGVEADSTDGDALMVANKSNRKDGVAKEDKDAGDVDEAEDDVPLDNDVKKEISDKRCGCCGHGCCGGCNNCCGGCGCGDCCGCGCCHGCCHGCNNCCHNCCSCPCMGDCCGCNNCG